MLIPGQRRKKKQPEVEKGGIINTIILFFGTSFYSGRIPLFPGTAGSAVGYLLWKLWSYSSPRPFSTFLCILFLGGFGCFLASRALLLICKGERNQFVWDEMLGFFIAMSFLSPGTYKNEATLFWVVFFVYRFINIVKPFPLGLLSRQEGVLGIMSEGIVAGIITMLVFFLPLESFWVPTLKLVLVEGVKLP